MHSARVLSVAAREGWAVRELSRKDYQAMKRAWFRLLIFGILYLLFGSFIFCHALFDQWTYREILQRGVTVTAHINSLKYNAGAFHNSYYIADFTWVDQSGLARTYRISLSIEFVDSITPNGSVTKADVPIKYLEENTYARPLVIGDEREREQIVSNDTRWGAGLFVSSLVLIVLLYAARRWLRNKSFATRRSPT
jgi:hypothetical protein